MLPRNSKQALEAKKFIWSESLAAFSIQCLGYERLNPRTHRDMIGALESLGKRKLIIMPRGTFKTTISSVAYPIWLLTKNPNLRIMLDSELYTNSKMRVREIRGHLDSDSFIRNYGNWKGPVWSDGELVIAQRTRIMKEPTIFASGISASKTGVHADFIIADDLNSPMNTNNADNALKVIEHIKYYTSILDPDGTLVFIGTRYSALDCYQWIIDQHLSEEQRERLKRI